MHRDLVGGVLVRGGLKARASGEVVSRPQQGVPQFTVLHRPGHRRIHQAGRLLPLCSQVGARLGGERAGGSTWTGPLRVPLDELLASARDRRPNGVLEPFKAHLNARFTETQGQVSRCPRFTCERFEKAVSVTLGSVLFRSCAEDSAPPARRVSAAVRS
ncbi:hypothetical protein [Streptomyces europaeiscabiei]|uniref:hypothetical protein n=1 Tax=Streptomyces europaeiscabiei TaxID=146819 RepID=UPI002E2CC5BB|nr:hypothetical protein [Streptomyces europaeiscabiei]